MRLFHKLFGRVDANISVQFSQRKVATPLLHAECPYCGVEISPPPKRQRKCPHCFSVVFIRLRHGESLNVLVTEEDAKRIDHDDIYYQRLSALDIDSKAERAIIEDLRVRFKRQPLLGDVVWAAMNRELAAAMKSRDFGEMHRIYELQAEQLAGEGKSCMDILAEAMKCRLLELQEFSFDANDRVQIFSPTNDNTACTHCRNLIGREFTFKTAFQSMPLPVRSCAYEWPRTDSANVVFCRCDYRLIRG